MSKPRLDRNQYFLLPFKIRQQDAHVENIGKERGRDLLVHDTCFASCEPGALGVQFGPPQSTPTTMFGSAALGRTPSTSFYASANERFRARELLSLSYNKPSLIFPLLSAPSTSPACLGANVRDPHPITLPTKIRATAFLSPLRPFQKK